ncbi:LRR receptor-like serine/threonine-protein kinase FLS2 [Hordeum vulgare]|nr:LRR receptor-like serine/threonine-protein kinase FLS2 [Hordeum vulgare]
MAETLGRIWCPVKGLECKEVGENIFLLMFGQESGKRMALEGGSWEFGSDLLVFEDFIASKRPDEYNFDTIPIWVWIMRLPLGMMCKEAGEAIGSLIGEVEEVEARADGKAMGRFLRVKVRMNIKVPLMRGFTLKEEDDEDDQKEQEEPHEKEEAVDEKNWCPFEYEHLPDFCYVCGIIGHTDKACGVKLKKGEKPQFGPWLPYKVTNGDPYHSDHRPVVLTRDGSPRVQCLAASPRLPRFEAKWLLEEDCDSIVENAWGKAMNPTIKNRLAEVMGALSNWNREVLGDLRKRIKKIKSELEAIRKEPISDHQVRKEQTLSFKLERLEEQENLVWRQRAHANWLTIGDRNTRYFHVYASERKKQNSITRLKREDGVVVEDVEGIKSLITNYFTSLFTPMAGADASNIL